MPQPEPSAPPVPRPTSDEAPVVRPPRPYVERRAQLRRREDRVLRAEVGLLARSLDLLVRDVPPEVRLAALLSEAARLAGARRAGLLTDDPERRVAVVLGPDEPAAVADDLGRWLDAQAPRSRAERAAAGRARVMTVVDPGRRPVPATEAAERAGERLASGSVRACLAVAAAGSLVLGFEFEAAAAADAVGERLPDALARHLAAALALASEQLHRQRELAELRARDEERGRYVSTVAHELRTPLTGLRGYLDLILDGRVSDEAVRQDFLERSRESVEGMSELVGDLLELSRLDAGSLALEIAPFSMAEAGQRTLDRLLPIALERGLALEGSLPPRIRAASGDRRRVEQVLTNLLGNALKFSPVGGTVELSAWTAGPVALFAVRDDGAGITSDDRTRIFDRFYRLASHQRVTGTGLGLPIARDLARAMGGDLAVASVPGTGSSFVLALPGPAPVEAPVVAAALERAIVDEELRLEERSVRRAIAAAGRALPGRAAGDAAERRDEAAPDAPRTEP
ncbi:MAG TPA: HAMP domain-containing sensor histidine kinase [Candidatus Limnocylindrales bacterium]